MELETIKTLAEKLRALAAPDSGATANEKQIAADKLKAILGRNKLTMEDVFSDEAKHEFYVECDSPQEITLLVQIAVTILGNDERVYYSGKITRQAFSKTGKLLKAKKKVTYIRITSLSLVEVTDLRNCSSHYRKILGDAMSDLAKERRNITKALKHADVGVIQKHNIFPDSPSDKPSKEPTLEEMKAMLRAIQHTGGTTWSRPSANIENPILHLT